MPAPDLSYIVSLRRELHAIPEVEFDLPKTPAVVRRELTALGYGPMIFFGYVMRGNY